MRVLNPQQVLSGAWQLFWGQRRAWFDLALVPLVWLLALDVLLLPNPSRIIAMTTASAPAQGGEILGFMGALLLYLILLLAVWSMFAAAWMRACLNLPLTAIPGLSWSVNEMRVLGAAFRLMLLLFAGFALIMILFGSGLLSRGLTPSTVTIFGFLALIAMAPILARSSLILPAAAIGQPARLGDSWRSSKGNGVRLAFLLAAIVLLSYFVMYVLTATAGGLLAGILGTPLSFGPRLVLHLVVNILSLASTAFVLAALSICYRQLTGPGLQVVPQERDSA